MCLNRFRIPGAVAAAALLASCEPAATESGLEVYRAYDRPATLPQNPDEVRVKVSTSRQRVYVMEGDKPLLIMPVSVGAPDTPTPHGTFRIVRKEARHRARAHGFAYSGDKIERSYREDKPSGWSFTGTPLPYWSEFAPDYGFHTGWIKHQPCTNGCIRIHENLAPKFFRLISVGTPVEIAASQPEDAAYGNIPLPPDAGPLPDHPDSHYLTDRYFTQHKNPDFRGALSP